MTALTIRRLTSGGVITNYHCVSRCGHCLYNCSPQRSRDYLTQDQAFKIFTVIAEMGCRSVHIGGGEPLLDLNGMTAVLAAARDAGVGIDYIETNSAWFQDARQADAVLETLRGAGVGTLLVSISPFHNAHIPFRRVMDVIAACRRNGVQVLPWVNAFVRDLDRLDSDRTHAMDDFERNLGPDYLARIPDRYWIHLGGRALETFRDVYPLYPAERILADSPLSCSRALSDTSHFHIDLHGQYIPGLCAGLAFHMEDLGAALPPERYPLLHRLATSGIAGLYRWAKQYHGYAPQRRFLNHCDLCTDIRSYLEMSHRDEFRELSPSGFYAELRRAV